MRNFIIGYIVGALAAGFARGFLESRDVALIEAITEELEGATIVMRAKAPQTEPRFSA